MIDNHSFDLDNFKLRMRDMIATNELAYSQWYGEERTRPVKNYTLEEIKRIINSNDLSSLRRLSRDFYAKDPIYKRVIIHYATLLKYAGLLIPHPSASKSLSTPPLMKRYNAALDYIDKMSIPSFLTNCALRALVDGCYYGFRLSTGKDNFVVVDLPAKYCRSYFKDNKGNDLIEFNVSYFSSITNEAERLEVLKSYPKEIRDYYNNWRKQKSGSTWVYIPAEIGICFPLFDGRPPFVGIVESIIQYGEAVETEIQRDLEEIRKVLVQRIPHLNDGSLLFEPDEAQVMHDGAVNMLKGNKNIHVLTTYADVDAIVSKTTNDASSNNVSNMMQNVYNEAGASSTVFAAQGSNTLESSLKNDMAYMMPLAYKFQNFITNVINELFANSNISFTYKILPVNYYNQEKFIDSSFKLASSGYSLLIPAIGLGVSQRELSDLKDLENDALKLAEKLLPLSSSYTQSAGGATGQVGRPATPEEEKSDKTIANEKSLDNQAGGSN